MALWKGKDMKATNRFGYFNSERHIELLSLIKEKSFDLLYSFKISNGDERC